MKVKKALVIFNESCTEEEVNHIMDELGFGNTFVIDQEWVLSNSSQVPQWVKDRIDLSGFDEIVRAFIAYRLFDQLVEETLTVVNIKVDDVLNVETEEFTDKNHLMAILNDNSDNLPIMIRPAPKLQPASVEELIRAGYAYSERSRARLMMSSRSHEENPLRKAFLSRG